VILTDRDLALMNIVEIVFPNSVNLICQFHIDINVGAKCKQYISKVEYQQQWKDIVWSPNEVEYNNSCKSLSNHSMVVARL
jgi:hypothetical protein